MPGIEPGASCALPLSYIPVCAFKPIDSQTIFFLNPLRAFSEKEENDGGTCVLWEL